MATVVYTGANSVLRTTKAGSLTIDVERRIAPDGTTKTTVSYQRNGPCRKERGANNKYFVKCLVLWNDKHTVPEAAFTIDALLGQASLTDVLRKQRVTVTWTGTGETRQQANENGNLLFQMRDATADCRWGTLHYVDPPATATPSSMFRRIPAP